VGDWWRVIFRLEAICVRRSRRRVAYFGENLVQCPELFFGGGGNAGDNFARWWSSEATVASIH